MTKCECDKTSTSRLYCHFGQACMGDDGAKECVDGCLHPEFSFLRTSNTYDNHELYEETHTLEYTYRSWDNIFYPPGKHNFSCMPGFGVAKFQASETILLETSIEIFLFSLTSLNLCVRLSSGVRWERVRCISVQCSTLTPRVSLSTQQI